MEENKNTLRNPSVVSGLVKKYQFAFQKKYGQNFLIDGNILDKIIQASELTKEDGVLEIGPGIGTMTQELARAAGKVVSVEIDKMLLPILAETLKEYENVTVINEDILKVDLKQLAEEQFENRPISVTANLPYYITTPIIMNLFESGIPLKSITIMVQKEVADRMQAGPGSKDYGALSLAVQYYAKPEIVTYVSAGCFMPKPKVGSAVIQLKKYEIPPVKVQDEAFLFQVIRGAFHQRRKTLVNGLTNYFSGKYTKEQVQTVLLELGLPLTIRGEALTLDQFAKLSDRLLQ